MGNGNYCDCMNDRLVVLPNLPVQSGPNPAIDESLPLQAVLYIPHHKRPKMEKSQLKKIQYFEPFFDGQVLEGRMKYIRENFIEPIRAKYNKQLFKTNMETFIKKFPQFKQLITKIEYSYWYDKIDQLKTKQFKLIRFYTMEDANQIMIGLINRMLRQKEFQDKELFELGVFLIEAINIELFLLTLHKPMLNNYQGTVYRGFTCTKEDYQKFIKIQQKKLQDRVISVPLSLWGSSKKLSVAQDFLQIRQSPEKISIILQIYIIGLDSLDLEQYRTYFPQSIVSTICAVDISDPTLTVHPQEYEVLLRGAFCLILKFENVKKTNQINETFQYNLIHCVMVNANRDHISTNSLGEKADSARNMFGSMAKKARLNFAYKFFGENKNEQSQKLEKYYGDLAQKQVENIKKIRPKIRPNEISKEPIQKQSNLKKIRNQNNHNNIKSQKNSS